MNLTKLFEAQRVLDERIEQKHPVKTEEDRVAMKILALQVELGECANEWRGFKFWSNDQEPRTYTTRTVSDGYRLKSRPYNPLLEELVDCLHFFLSIGNDIQVSNNRMNFLIGRLGDWKFMNGPTDGFNLTFFYVSTFETNRDIEAYYDAFVNFMTLVVWLDITLEELEAAYYEKNKINHERQDANY